MVQRISPVFFPFLENGVLFRGHIICEELVVLRIILRVKVVLRLLRVIGVNGLRLRYEELRFLLICPVLLLLLQAHHFLDHREVRNGLLGLSLLLILHSCVIGPIFAVFGDGVRANQVLPEGRIVQLANRGVAIHPLYIILQKKQILRYCILERKFAFTYSGWSVG